MLRAGRVLLASAMAIAAGACSLFLDSNEFASEDGRSDDRDADVARDDGGTPETGTNGDAGIDAAIDGDAGDDLCTRSFATAQHFDSFELAPITRWSRYSCRSHASFSKVDGDGQPGPSVSFVSDSGIPAEEFQTCWLEKALGVGRTFRFGFDVKLASPSINGSIAVARLNFEGPQGATVGAYTASIGHGFTESGVEHRYALTAGGVKFQTIDGLGPSTSDWVSYRFELAIGAAPSGAARQRVCRNGVLVSDKVLDYPLEVPSADSPPVFDIGFVYTNEPQPALDVRFDNAFAEVVP